MKTKYWERRHERKAEISNDTVTRTRPIHLPRCGKMHIRANQMKQNSRKWKRTPTGCEPMLLTFETISDCGSAKFVP